MGPLIKGVSLAVGLLFTQMPEFLQQYGQRVGGAADELTAIIRHFDEDALRSGHERHSALELMKRNAERLVREQAVRMETNIVRLRNLQLQQAAFAGGPSVSAAFAFLANGDWSLARKTV